MNGNVPNVPAGKVLGAADLVAYQEGTVVSRTVVDKPQGTVTAFAFAAGQGLSEHTAPYDALAFILEGEAAVTISATAHKVRAGEMIIMPAGEPHAVRALSAFKMLLVMIRQ